MITITGKDLWETIKASEDFNLLTGVLAALLILLLPLMYGHNEARNQRDIEVATLVQSVTRTLKRPASLETRKAQLSYIATLDGIKDVVYVSRTSTGTFQFSPNFHIAQPNLSHYKKTSLGTETIYIMAVLPLAEGWYTTYLPYQIFFGCLIFWIFIVFYASKEEKQEEREERGEEEYQSPWKPFKMDENYVSTTTSRVLLCDEHRVNEVESPEESLLPDTFKNYLDSATDKDLFYAKLSEGILKVEEIHAYMDSCDPEEAENIACKMIESYRYDYKNVPLKHRTEKVTYRALDRNDDALDLMPKNLVNEKLYIYLAGRCLGWDKIPDDKITEQVVKAKIEYEGSRHYGRDYQRVPKDVWNANLAMSLASYGNLEAIPAEWRSELVYRKAVSVNQDNIRLVPDEYFNKMFPAIFEACPEIVFSLGDRTTSELISEAVKRKPRLATMRYPEKYMTQELANLAWQEGSRSIPHQFQTELMAKKLFDTDMCWEVAGRFWSDARFKTFFTMDKKSHDDLKWGDRGDWDEGENCIYRVKNFFHDPDLFTKDRMKFILSEDWFPRCFETTETKLGQQMLIRLVEVLTEMGRGHEAMDFLSRRPRAAKLLGMTEEQLAKCGVVEPEEKYSGSGKRIQKAG